MAPFVVDKNSMDTVYDLYSCIVHTSKGGLGHFMSYTWSNEEKSWFKFDDNTAEPTTPENLLTQNPYLLFYVLRSCSGKIVELPVEIIDEDGIHGPRSSDISSIGSRSITPSMSSSVASKSDGDTSPVSQVGSHIDIVGSIPVVKISTTAKVVPKILISNPKILTGAIVIDYDDFGEERPATRSQKRKLRDAIDEPELFLQGKRH